MKKINGNETVERDGLVYHQDTNELVTGFAETFHENGQLEQRTNYIDGVQNGLSEDFYENGQLEARGTYIDGELDGLHEEFHENGQLKFRGKRLKPATKFGEGKSSEKFIEVLSTQEFWAHSDQKFFQ